MFNWHIQLQARGSGGMLNFCSGGSRNLKSGVPNAKAREARPKFLRPRPL